MLKLNVLLMIVAIPYQMGTASYYALDGNRTASGEIFKSHLLTAAHRTLPFGSVVEVQRCDKSKAVQVRINDRGPFHKNRIIDLSPAAFKQIAKLNEGTTCVHIHVIKKGSK